MGLPKGSIRFRPCGGNTMRRVSDPLSRWALRHGQQWDALQLLVLTRSEVEFFPSEGCFFHWAAEDRPDFIIFGLTCQAMAMIISEALEIPIVGFILQPGKGLEARANPASVMDEIAGPLRDVIDGPTFATLLTQVMERLPTTATLNSFRTSRQLQPCPTDIGADDRHHEELIKAKVPIIVPINQYVLGGEAEKMKEMGMTLTDFIFLRLNAEVLDPETASFIENARQNHRKIVAMTFSSMPVGERRMLAIASDICLNCMPKVENVQDRHKPAVIVMAGGQEHDPAPLALEEEVEELAKEGRILVLRRGLPFGALFPKIDAAILHGGLGVTSEAVVAGIPVITSGVLLMDQRYWAARLFELGVGSEGVPMTDLPVRAQTYGGQTKVVELMTKALDQRENPPEEEAKEAPPAARVPRLSRPSSGPRASDPLNASQPLPTATWFQAAQALKLKMDGGDGVELNARIVFEAGMAAEPLTDTYRRGRGCLRTGCRQCLCLVLCFQKAISWCLCTQVLDCVRLQLRCVRWCVCCQPLRNCCYFLYRRNGHRLPIVGPPQTPQMPLLQHTMSHREESIHQSISSTHTPTASFPRKPPLQPSAASLKVQASCGSLTSGA